MLLHAEGSPVRRKSVQCRGVGQNHFLQICCLDAGVDSQRKEIDDFLGMRPQQMGAENSIAAFFNQHLEPRVFFSHTAV